MTHRNATTPFGSPLTPAAQTAAGRPSFAVAAAVAAGLAAGWLGAGSAGLLSYALQRALVWVALGAAVASAWPRETPAFWRVLMALAAACVAVLMVASALPAVRVLAAAVVLAALARGRREPDRHALLLGAVAVAALALYRHAVTSVPFLWLAADTVGGLLGRAAGRLTGQPLWVGATFGGLDFLVPMVVLGVAWLVTTRPRPLRAVVVLAAIPAGHAAYLCVLAFAPKLLAALPVPAPPDAAVWPPRVMWSLVGAVRAGIPWNMPVIACMVHAVIAAVMLRSPAGRPDSEEAATVPASRFRWARWVLPPVVALLAIAVPVLTTLCWQKCELKGKKIVLYKEGYLNWDKPVHGTYGERSIGMYGMLEPYIESLGGQYLRSDELAKSDLKDADVLILLFPNEKWPQDRLERIREFVRRGGSLAIFGEHTTLVKGTDKSAFNAVLEGLTSMQVRFDSAMFEIGGWLQSYEALAHPATVGIADERNQFGVTIGASVDARWPARPVLAARWGWADPGNPKNGLAMMGNGRYDPGEKLGDLVLAAEQEVGKGRVIAFGDTSSMANGINIAAHMFTSRLLGYLANSPDNPQATRRGVLGLIATLLLIGLIARRPDPWRVLLFAVLAAGTMVVCTEIGCRASEILPDGRVKTPNNLAYIDFSHAPAASAESWRDDGTMGIAMTLMREGFVVLDLTEFTPERLERAGLLLEIAPNREFSAAERRAVRRFVENGGILIWTVGYDDSGPSRSLLADFDLCVGEEVEDKESTPLGLYNAVLGTEPPGSKTEARQPAPLGWFRSPYLRTEEYKLYVRFHAGWPVEIYAYPPLLRLLLHCEFPKPIEHRVSFLRDWRVVAYGAGDVPIIIDRQVGNGHVVLVGDTGFAMNKNLENKDGSPIGGLRENAHFWRWLLSVLRGQKTWIPPQETPAEGVPCPICGKIHPVGPGPPTKPDAAAPQEPAEPAEPAGPPGEGAEP